MNNRFEFETLTSTVFTTTDVPFHQNTQTLNQKAIFGGLKKVSGRNEGASLKSKIRPSEHYKEAWRILLVQI